MDNPSSVATESYIEWWPSYLNGYEENISVGYITYIMDNRNNESRRRGEAEVYINEQDNISYVRYATSW